MLRSQRLWRMRVLDTSRFSAVLADVLQHLLHPSALSEYRTVWQYSEPGHPICKPKNVLEEFENRKSPRAGNLEAESCKAPNAANSIRINGSSLCSAWAITETIPWLCTLFWSLHSSVSLDSSVRIGNSVASQRQPSRGLEV